MVFSYQNKGHMGSRYIYIFRDGIWGEDPWGSAKDVLPTWATRTEWTHTATELHGRVAQFGQRSFQESRFWVISSIPQTLLVE